MFVRSLAVSTLLGWVVTAKSIQDQFALDGDATYDGGSVFDPEFPRLDWNLIASYVPPGGEEQCGNMDLEANGIRGVFSGIIHDRGADNFDEICQFDQAKDTINTAEYKWSHSSVPDKSDIVNAYVFAMLDKNNTINVYFGMDIPADTGSATVGIWLLQEEVGPVCDDGSEFTYPNGCNSGYFEGNHRDGDLLILAEIGKDANIRLMTWEGGADGSLNENGPVLETEDSTCALGFGGGTFGVNQVCAITNGQNEVPVCWSHTPKGTKGKEKCYTGCKVGSERFFEGGINLQHYYQMGLDEEYPPCSRRFLAETRTSESASADLKDFAIGTVDMCGYESSMECSRPTAVGNGQWQFNVSVNVKNTGLMKYYNLQVKTASGEVLATVESVDPAFDIEPVLITWIRDSSFLDEVLTLEYCVSPESPCRAERHQSREMALVCGFTTTETPTSTTETPTSTTETPTSTTETPTSTTETPTSTTETPTSTTETPTSTTETPTSTTETPTSTTETPTSTTETPTSTTETPTSTTETPTSTTETPTSTTETPTSTTETPTSTTETPTSTTETPTSTTETPTSTTETPTKFMDESLANCSAPNVEETSFCTDDDAIAFDQSLVSKNRWGWSLPLTLGYDQSVDFFSIGGAGDGSWRCDGKVTVARYQVENEADLFNVTWKGNGALCVRFSEFHVYIGDTIYPMHKNGKRYTLSPGSYGCGVELQEAVASYTLQCRSELPVEEEFYLIIHSVSIGDRPTAQGNDFCDDVVIP